MLLLRTGRWLTKDIYIAETLNLNTLDFFLRVPEFCKSDLALFWKQNTNLSASFKVIKLVAEVVTFEISLESLSHFAIVVFLDPFTGTSIRQVLPFAPFLFLYHGFILSLWCLSILVNYYFQVSFNWKIILFVDKMTQTTVAVTSSLSLSGKSLTYLSTVGSISESSL